jgi:glycosyltransferase involved in cell wall biosynthesis
MASITVLHITAHLGGGVGRALSQLACYRRASGSQVEDAFVSLEKPQTRSYVDRITACGAKVLVAPAAGELDALIAAADLVQLEWWHHPLLAAWMNRNPIPPARLVVWAHTSGLHYPVIPPVFTIQPHAFLLTSEISLRRLDRQGHPRGNILAVVSSTGGFDDLPFPRREAHNHPRFGYLGSLNPAKLHPDIVSYLDAVDLPGFRVDFYGDVFANPQLQSWAEKAGPTSRLALRGYTDSPGSALSGMDVFVYLLNPTHYGTTENALLEAMACGVVPVVLNNPVEETIVQNGITGLVVDSPRSFADAITWLVRHPQERLRLSAACATVRDSYSVGNSAGRLDAIYRRVVDEPKRCFEFNRIFGNSPADWFLSCLGSYSRHFSEESEICGREERLQYPFLYERTKSSVFQFLSCFPADPRLARWAAMLERDLCGPSVPLTGRPPIGNSIRFSLGGQPACR